MNKFFTSILLLFSLIGFSQIQNEDDFIPKSGSVFTLEKNKIKKTGYEGYKHSIKWSPFMIVRGLTGLNYEYKPFENFSFALGTGFDHFEDYLAIFSEGYSFYFSNSYINVYDLVLDNPRTAQNVIYFNPSISFYYESLWTYNQSYLKIDYRFRSKKYQYEYIGDDINPDETFDIRLTQNSINIINGLQYVGGNRIKIIHELYYGLGLNIFKHSDLTLIEVENNGFIENQIGISNKKSTQLGLSFLIGYTVGIGW